MQRRPMLDPSLMQKTLKRRGSLEEIKWARRMHVDRAFEQQLSLKWQGACVFACSRHAIALILLKSLP